jgi:hypothetical protein
MKHLLLTATCLASISVTPPWQHRSKPSAGWGATPATAAQKCDSKRRSRYLQCYLYNQQAAKFVEKQPFLAILI